MQTSHPRKQTAALAGQLSDTSFVKHADSLRNDNASAEIAFGLMVRRGTSEGGALTLSATSQALGGIVVRDHAYDQPNELGDTGLKPDVVMTVLQRGRIWVPVEEAVAVGNDVRVRAVATGDEVAGAFRTTADSTDCIDISAFARWVTGGSTVAELEIDMLQAALASADV
jgi:hypothetical protein